MKSSARARLTGQWTGGQHGRQPQRAGRPGEQPGSSGGSSCVGKQEEAMPALWASAGTPGRRTWPGKERAPGTAHAARVRRRRRRRRRRLVRVGAPASVSRGSCAQIRSQATHGKGLQEVREQPSSDGARTKLAGSTGTGTRSAATVAGGCGIKLRVQLHSHRRCRTTYVGAGGSRRRCHLSGRPTWHGHGTRLLRTTLPIDGNLKWLLWEGLSKWPQEVPETRNLPPLASRRRWGWAVPVRTIKLWRRPAAWTRLMCPRSAPP